MPRFLIREASPADIPLILTLIREMAAYEGKLERVRIDEGRLRRHVFCDRPLATIFIAEEDGEPIGYGLIHPTFSSFAGVPNIYLEDLLLRDHVRGKGYGKRFMAYLARYVKERGYRYLIWSVLDWNTPSIDFYERLNAVRDTGRFHYSLEGEALDRLATLDWQEKE